MYPRKAYQALTWSIVPPETSEGGGNTAITHSECEHAPTGRREMHIVTSGIPPGAICSDWTAEESCYIFGTAAHRFLAPSFLVIFIQIKVVQEQPVSAVRHRYCYL